MSKNLPQDRIARVVARYSRDVSTEPRDDHGRWTSSGGNVGKVNEILTSHGLPNVTVDEEGNVSHHTGHEFSEEDYQALMDAHDSVSRINSILQKHGHEPIRMTENFESPHYVEDLEYADESIRDANKFFEKHGMPNRATLIKKRGEYEASVDAEELQIASESVDEANKYLSKLTNAPTAKLKSYDGKWESTIDPGDAKSMAAEVAVINKRLASYGLEPKVGLKMISGGSLAHTHDIDEISGALDMLKAFKKGKGAVAEVAETPDNPEQYSRRVREDDSLKCLVDFIPSEVKDATIPEKKTLTPAERVNRAVTRYSTGTAHWVTLEPSGTHVELDGTGNVTKGPDIHRGKHESKPKPEQKPVEPPAAPAWFRGKKKESEPVASNNAPASNNANEMTQPSKGIPASDESLEAFGNLAKSKSREVAPEEAQKLRASAYESFAKALGLTQNAGSGQRIQDFEARLSGGIANYSRLKSMPGQMDLFSGEERASSKTQSRLDWDETKHPRAANGEFATKEDDASPTVIQELSAEVEKTFQDHGVGKVENSEGNETEEASSNNSEFPPGVSKSDIPLSLGYNAHRGTSHVPDQRAEYEQRSYLEHMQAVWSNMSKLADTPEKKEMLAEEWKRYREGYLAKTKALLYAKSRVMSPMITGPARFPVNANRKANDSADKRREELLEFDKKAQNAIVKKLRPDIQPIKIGDAGAEDAISMKLKRHETLQEKMKEANKIIRSSKNLTREEAEAKLMAIGFSESTASEVMKPDYMGRVGFPDYRIKNNGAEIRRLRERLKQQQTRKVEESKAETGERPTKFEFDGGEVHLDYEDNRIRIQHDTKPPRDVIDKLKSNGFRWSPSNGAWQRQLTNAAKYAATSVVGVKFAAEHKSDAEDDDRSQYSRPVADRIESVIARYSSRDTGWITIGAREGEDGKKHGGTPVQIGEGGQIRKGPVALKGDSLDSLKDPEQRHARSARAAHAAVHGHTGHDVTARQAQALGNDRAIKLHQAAKEAARGTGVSAVDTMRMIPEAHKYLTEQNRLREVAKENARRITGLTAGDIARHENAYRDHSTVDNFDTAARTVAMEHPELGIDPDDHDAPAKVWELIREGKVSDPAMHSPEVAGLAAEWLAGDKSGKKGKKKDQKADSDDREPGIDEGDFDDWGESKHTARTGAEDVVPFSKRIELAIANYAKRAPAAGQRSLEEHWITLHGDHEGGGAHVRIDKDGNITAGPAALAAKGIKKLSDFGGGGGGGESTPSKPAYDKQQVAKDYISGAQKKLDERKRDLKGAEDNLAFSRSEYDKKKNRAHVKQLKAEIKDLEGTIAEHQSLLDPRTESHVVAEKRDIAHEMDHIARMSGAMGHIGIAPDYAEKHAELRKKHEALSKEHYEITRPQREAKEKEDQERRDAHWDKEQQRVAGLPTKERKNGWEIATDGANYFVRDPNTKEQIYKGKLSRCREVAAESAPDNPVESKPEVQSRTPAQASPEKPKLMGRDQEDFDFLAPSLSRHLDNEVTPHRKWNAVNSMIHGLAPSLREALVEHAFEHSPEIADYVRDYPQGVSLGAKDSIKNVLARRAAQSSKPAATEAAEEEPVGWSPEKHLKIAADSIGQLRGQDVYRLMESAPPAYMQSMANFIQKHRPEFSRDIHDARLEIEEERSGAAKPAESKPAEPAKRPGVPGMQSNLFDEDTSGQKQLFNYVPPKKGDLRKKAENNGGPASLLESIEDEQKSREAQSKPLFGQKGLYSRSATDRINSAIDRARRSGLPRFPVSVD